MMNKKTQIWVTRVLCAILILAMVLPMVIGALA